jgi:hypothetical protein
MAILYKVDGTYEEVHPTQSKSKTFTVEELQSFVGGYFELIRLRGAYSNKYLVLNEDGIDKRLPINAMATALYHPYLTVNSIGNLLGDILVCSLNEVD